MVVRRSRKVTKQRGSGTHGYGVKRRHRGGGNKGGKGKAGTNAHHKIKSKKEGTYLGKHGMKTRGMENKERAINIRDLDQRLNKLQEMGKIEKKGDLYEIDLKKLGYDKLLGEGVTTKKMRIIGNASKSAVTKIQEIGGEIITQ